jgi:GNAT superfamily N-acetyltransferase
VSSSQPSPSRHGRTGRSSADASEPPIPVYEIAPARAEDLPFLPAIELAAGTLFDGHGPESVLAESVSEEVFGEAQRQGRLWVARADGVPVGFALVVVAEPTAAHLEELDVHPAHGRRGLGTRLVEAVCGWAAVNGYGQVTLVTFRDLPWNMPFYARRGFEVIPDVELSAPLRLLAGRTGATGTRAARRGARRPWRSRSSARTSCRS